MSISMSRAALEAEKRKRDEIKYMTQAVIRDEVITRTRVVNIEAILSRGFWGRLRWLLRGK